METIPRFLQGIFPFTGMGFETSERLSESLAFAVSDSRRAQLIYFRAGNSADGLIAVSLLRDGKLMRIFPLGAKAAVHVPLAVVEDLQPGTSLDVHVSAPGGVSGHVVLDIGLIEI